ncbi:MAG TPA: BadF/BadG/BcrA/BcrD ATPase family protein [Streptosporangiaceae bacterium]
MSTERAAPEPDGPPGGSGNGDRVLAGIDAGGSSTRALAVAGGRVVFAGRGGPGNPLAAGQDALTASYLTALAGCPDPAAVAACVSGAGGARERGQIADLLADRFPGASIQVVPDYAGAILAAPDGTDVVVIAGTGSVVCSPAGGGRYHVSGGRGWILGDRGGAARLGQAALEWYCADRATDPEVTAQVRDCLGQTDWRGIVAALAVSPNPAALLASAAPVLTAAAEGGADWATTRLAAEMSALAAVTCRHIERHLSPAGQVRVALTGGVWASPAARAAFSHALAAPGSPSRARITILPDPLDPLDGAIRLAGLVSQPD